jgi:hypothetical protein
MLWASGGRCGTTRAYNLLRVSKNCKMLSVFFNVDDRLQHWRGV